MSERGRLCGGLPPGTPGHWDKSTCPKWTATIRHDLKALPVSLRHLGQLGHPDWDTWRYHRGCFQPGSRFRASGSQPACYRRAPTLLALPLLHFRSALVAILMLPVGVLMAFGAMKLLGLGSNIICLGGLAIAIGAMVDAAIVMIENAHKHLERAEPDQSRVKILIDAASEVGPALFFSLLIITVSFMPIFTLESQEGRLFSPLAFTK